MRTANTLHQKHQHTTLNNQRNNLTDIKTNALMNNMKYKIMIILLCGSAWGCPDYEVEFDEAFAERWPNLAVILESQTYLDTVEVCDTVWYYLCYEAGDESVKDSLPEIKYRKSIICKQKKQVWLTEDEYDKLMELLNPPRGITAYDIEQIEWDLFDTIDLYGENAVDSIDMAWR